MFSSTTTAWPQCLASVSPGLSTTPTTVDTTSGPKVLKTSGSACQKLVDIYDHYKIQGSKKDMDSHVDLAEAIIDPYYRGMKVECGKNKPAWHMA
ncbi:hypothetical protein D1007_39613 [Hordeum vulgare]|nr:hypothetical protein D1007_39613 [Hordeum vulgare]